MNEFNFNVRQGRITVRWNADRLVTGLDWDPSAPGFQAGAFRLTRNIPKHVLDLIWLLNRYFESGDPVVNAQWCWPWYFVDQSGWTDFQKAVFREVCRIPHGETRTYGWVAWRLGRIGATRAVGQALRSNPVPILVPCHRVVAANSIGGFMGKADPSQPELQFKTELLKLEDRFRQPEFPFFQAEAAV